MFFTKRCPSGGTEYVSFELFLGILRGPGEGRGGAPGTVPLQNPEVTSRKACLRNADLLPKTLRLLGGKESFSWFYPYLLWVGLQSGFGPDR